MIFLRKWSLGLTLWLTNLMQFNSTQNRTFYSLLNPVSGSEGYERNVWWCVKNADHWHNYRGHLGKQEVQRLWEDQYSLFRQMGTEKHLMWEAEFLKKLIGEDIPGEKNTDTTT